MFSRSGIVLAETRGDQLNGAVAACRAGRAEQREGAEDDAHRGAPAVHHHGRGLHLRHGGRPRRGAGHAPRTPTSPEHWNAALTTRCSLVVGRFPPSTPRLRPRCSPVAATSQPACSQPSRMSADERLGCHTCGGSQNRSSARAAGCSPDPPPAAWLQWLPGTICSGATCRCLACDVAATFKAGGNCAHKLSHRTRGGASSCAIAWEDSCGCNSQMCNLRSQLQLQICLLLDPCACHIAPHGGCLSPCHGPRLQNVH
jgi:hypothetical protein